MTKSDLKILRNKYILNTLQKKSYSISDIASIFNLSEQHLKNSILSTENVTLYKDRENHSPEDLNNYIYYLYDTLTEKGLTENAVLYMLNRTSLDPSQDYALDWKSSYQKLYDEIDTLYVAYGTLKAAYNKLKTQTSINPDSSTLESTIQTLKKELSSKETELIICQHDYTKAKQAIDDLTKKISNEATEQNKIIKDLKESFNESQQKAIEKELEQNRIIKDLKTSLETSQQKAIDKELEQNRIIKDLEASLNESQQDYANLKALNTKLQNNLDTHSATTLYAQAELKNKSATIRSLELENETLKAQIASVPEKQEKISRKFERVYTDLQRQQMTAIYLKNKCKRKATLEAVRVEMNISISDKHLVRILREEGVFRSTYKARKQKK